MFIFFSLADIEDFELASTALGFIPSVANDIRILPQNYQIIPDQYYGLTAVSSAFIHADILHLIGNMLFIWVFADNVEDATGHFKFLIFYLLCAVFSAWFHALTFPDSDAPLVGASGAAAGVLAAYLMLHPKVKIWVLVFARIPVRLPAYVLLGSWIAYQGVMYVIDPDGQVSWAAHVGGIVSGILLIFILKRKDISLFDRDIVEAEQQVHSDADASETLLPPSSEQTHWGRDSSSN